MKLSVPFSTVYPRYDAETAVKLLVDAGFDAADFDLDPVRNLSHPYNADGWRELFEELRRIADRYGFSFNQAHAPFHFTTHEWENEESFRSYVMPCFIHTLEICGILGVKVCVVHPLHYYVYEGHEEFFFEKNMAYYRELLPYAKQFNVKIGVENMWNRDPRRGVISHDTCSSTKEFLRYVDTLNDEYAVACLDLGHVGLVYQPEEIWDFIRALGHDRLLSLHVHDNNFKDDQHYLPYNGKIDWDKVTQALGEIDYAGDFTYETAFSVSRMHDEFVPTALRYMADLGHHLCDLVDRNRPIN